MSAVELILLAACVMAAIVAPPLVTKRRAEDEARAAGISVIAGLGATVMWATVGAGWWQTVAQIWVGAMVVGPIAELVVIKTIQARIADIRGVLPDRGIISTDPWPFIVVETMDDGSIVVRWRRK